MGGRDKLLEEVGGHALVRTMALCALATNHPVFVTVPACGHPRALAISDLDLNIVPVSNAVDGISASLCAGIMALPDASAFMVMLADLVDIRTQDINALFQARHEHPDALIWRAATRDGKPGHPIVFDAPLRREFANLTGDQGASSVIAKHRAHVHLVPIGDQARRDLDTPEDWAKWRARP
jgi:CTP:molybdopterin cytidylyltransferase MocA